MQPAAPAAIRAAADAAGVGPSPADLPADPRRPLQENVYVLARDGVGAAAGGWRSPIRRADTPRRFGGRPPRAARTAAAPTARGASLKVAQVHRQDKTASRPAAGVCGVAAIQ